MTYLRNGWTFVRDRIAFRSLAVFVLDVIILSAVGGAALAILELQGGWRMFVFIVVLLTMEKISPRIARRCFAGKGGRNAV